MLCQNDMSKAYYDPLVQLATAAGCFKPAEGAASAPAGPAITALQLLLAIELESNPQLIEELLGGCGGACQKHASTARGGGMQQHVMVQHQPLTPCSRVT